MLQQVEELYPQDESKFQASESWRQKIFKRFRVSFRKCTRLQPLPIAERIDVIIEFYRKIRWICTTSPFVIPCTPVYRDSYKWGRFPLNKRHHADEVPLDFQGVLSRTAAPKGAGGVHTRLPKVKLDHRVASLMLCFTAEGHENPCRPAICFALTPNESQGYKDPRKPAAAKTQREIAELQRLYPNILFYVQKKGYFDTVTCMAWLQDTMQSFIKSGDHLLCLDNLGAHVNPDFRRAAWQHKPKVWLTYTPADCTDACAVTDDGLGRAFKNKMRKSFVTHFNANIDLWQGVDGLHMSASNRRQLYAKWLDDAFTSFYGWNAKTGKSGHKVVREAFERCGMANALDGTDDKKIKISGWDQAIIL